MRAVRAVREREGIHEADIVKYMNNYILFGPNATIFLYQITNLITELFENL